MNFRIESHFPGRLKALELAHSCGDSASDQDRVARKTSVEDARWAFLQKALRKRAAQKFSRANEMLFTSEALEQATSEQVARYRASRFPENVAICDWTCSIGADLIALAAGREAVGIDLHLERLLCARWNLDVNGVSAELMQADCLSSAAQTPYAFADPARRMNGRRTLNLDDFAPNPQLVAEKFRKLRLGAIKLSPMLSDSIFEQFGDRLEFWSSSSECKEAVIWLGDDAGEGRHAVHLESGGILAANDLPFSVEVAESYFYEADPAAIRAHALGTLCDQLNLSAYGDSNGYLTGGQLVQSPWLKSYRVIDELPGQVEKTRSLLKSLHSKTPVIKSRIAKVDVERLRRDLKLNGDRDLIVAVAPLGPKLRHIILEPCE